MRTRIHAEAEEWRDVWECTRKQAEDAKQDTAATLAERGDQINTLKSELGVTENGWEADRTLLQEKIDSLHHELKDSEAVAREPQSED